MSVTGSDVAGLILGVGGIPREHLLAQLATDSLPPLLTTWAQVRSEAGGHAAVLDVSPDYIGLGTNEDWIRTPTLPLTAQRIADARGMCLLPTRKLVDLIYAQAPLKLEFTAKQPRAGVPRDSSVLYLESNAAIEAQRAGRTGLAAGHKKDIVVGNLLARNPSKVVIYGAWNPRQFAAPGNAAGRVQPYSNVHSGGYVDYSHGARLVSSMCVVDGRAMATAELYRHPTLSVLVSDEGPVRAVKYLPPPPQPLRY